MIELRHASFCYAPGVAPALDDVSLTIAPGERVVLLGLNGSGKSTLARLLNGALRPSSGEVAVDGVVSSAETARELARRVGFVRQDPRSQIVSSLVSDEVAFGPRNLGLSREEVRERVAGALDACGIADLAGRMTSELSGGQQQLLAVAGMLAMRPGYLVLDEASSQLDGSSRERLADVVRRLVEGGMGVLEIAHAPELVFGARRVVVLEAGHVAWEGTPTELFASERAHEAAGWGDEPVARALAEGVARGYELGDRPEPELLGRLLGPVEDARPACAPAPPHGHALELSGVTVSYGAQRALDGVSLGCTGSLTLVVGASGSGKTTMARVLAGVLAPDAGRALLDGQPVRAGQVGLSFQRPEDQLFADTVLDDISYGPRAQGMAVQEAHAAARAAARELGVSSELFDRSPFELSGGQMRRVALAGVLACNPAACVFDEPTAGLDVPSRALLRSVVCSLRQGGAAVVVITHDAAEWLDLADDVAFLAAGAVVAHEPVERVARSPELFSGAGLAAPFAVRLRAAREGARHG